MAYYIEADSTTPQVGKVRWVRANDLPTADAALAYVQKPVAPPKPIDNAARWLAEQLADGPVKANELFEAANVAGHSTKTLQRASKKLDVVKNRTKTHWLWSLPLRNPVDER